MGLARGRGYGFFRPRLFAEPFGVFFRAQPKVLDPVPEVIPDTITISGGTYKLLDRIHTVIGQGNCTVRLLAGFGNGYRALLIAQFGMITATDQSNNLIAEIPEGSSMVFVYSASNNNWIILQ